jgi:phage terminase large subunit-like protein
MTPRVQKPLHPAEQYARDAARGKITVNKWVKLAAKRHLDDLKHGKERGLWFDVEAAQRVLDFFSLLRHSKGEWAGQRVVLEPWQQFVLWVTFGWKRDRSDRWLEKLKDGRIEDTRGMRRFRTLYLEVARKNGKSTMAAGIGLYMLTADREGGPEVYAAATKKDQALITFAEADRMVGQSPALKKRVRAFKHNLHIPNTAAKFEPLGADSDTMDGLNTHCALVDELHAHKNSGVWDKLRTSQGSRRQPLMVAITTAGNDRSSFCYEMHVKAEQILSGKISQKDAESWFCIIYSLDAKDDIWAEKNWIKANPNLGVSKYWNYQRDEASNAKTLPSALNTFKQLDLNIWVQSSVSWMPAEHWDACAGDVEALDFPDLLQGRTCFGALDLASVLDIAAFVLDFPPVDEDDRHWVLCHFYCPEDTVFARSKSEGIHYDEWVEQGYITATPGNVIDYDYILDDVQAAAELFDLKEMAYDRWGAANIAQKMQDNMGLVVVTMGQGFVSMSAPMKELERRVKGHLIYHGGQPVLSWMADNVVASLDAAGNIKPDKAKSKEKIDGITALIMAISRTIDGVEQKSVYEERGIVTV